MLFTVCGNFSQCLDELLLRKEEQEDTEYIMATLYFNNNPYNIKYNQTTSMVNEQKMNRRHQLHVFTRAETTAGIKTILEQK